MRKILLLLLFCCFHNFVYHHHYHEYEHEFKVYLFHLSMKKICSLSWRKIHKYSISTRIKQKFWFFFWKIYKKEFSNLRVSQFWEISRIFRIFLRSAFDLTIWFLSRIRLENFRLLLSINHLKKGNLFCKINELKKPHSLWFFTLPLIKPTNTNLAPHYKEKRNKCGLFFQ